MPSYKRYASYSPDELMIRKLEVELHRQQKHPGYQMITLEMAYHLQQLAKQRRQNIVALCDRKHTG